MPRSLSPRQLEALEWLRGVGKATHTTLARHGYQVHTMDSLVRHGVATKEMRSGIATSYPVWRAKEEEQ